MSCVGFQKTVELTIEKGADVNTLNQDLDSALTLATERGNFGVCNFMIDSMTNLHRSRRNCQMDNFSRSKHQYCEQMRKFTTNFGCTQRY